MDSSTAPPAPPSGVRPTALRVALPLPGTAAPAPVARPAPPPALGGNWSRRMTRAVEGVSLPPARAVVVLVAPAAVAVAAGEESAGVGSSVYFGCVCVCMSELACGPSILHERWHPLHPKSHRPVSINTHAHTHPSSPCWRPWARPRPPQRAAAGGACGGGRGSRGPASGRRMRRRRRRTALAAAAAAGAWPRCPGGGGCPRLWRTGRGAAAAGSRGARARGGSGGRRAVLGSGGGAVKRMMVRQNQERSRGASVDWSRVLTRSTLLGSNSCGEGREEELVEAADRAECGAEDGHARPSRLPPLAGGCRSCVGGCGGCVCWFCVVRFGWQVGGGSSSSNI